ncbi:MAG: hypothetical protein MSA90_04610 [Faecalicatena sp.]|uniref:hypothetical protein n=1 Tax=Faecalicatena sp. TaxID=2005360 RepID=UPI002582F8A0|nr:hypothetical protein [Faecalicatena sp.]MCI6464732.1 hypothetical protein [Faecalicatena sp.]MDY5618310.1 hypothetical protein [Lachnospiraceae bacterium]
MPHVFTGKLKEPIIDYLTGNLTILFEPSEDFRHAYEELKDCDKLRLEIKKYRRKRSLDANAYYWVLITKLAKVIGLSNPETHNMVLWRYGQPEIFEGKGVYMTIPDTEGADRKVRNATDYHLQPTSQVRAGKDGIIYRTYRLLRGSHTYNTEEMARLIDGLITLCKDAGISDSEIATPDERRILKERYGVEIG